MPSSDQRSQEAQAYRKWYKTYRWQKLATACYVRDLYTCQRTGEILSGKHPAPNSPVANHIIPHKGNPELFWDMNNIETVAKSVHDSDIQSEERGGKRAFNAVDANGWPTDNAHPINGGDGIWTREVIERRMPSDLKPSNIPITIVCGPPGGGKSTYIREHMVPTDVLIDLDNIMSEISGQAVHHTSAKWLVPAMEERNRMLRSLATDTTHSKAWFIVSSPKPSERATWKARLRAELILIAPPLDVCIARIQGDTTRTGQTDRMIDAAKRWWATNMREMGWVEE